MTDQKHVDSEPVTFARDGNNVNGDTADGTAPAGDEAPKSFKFIAIFIALCLAVLCQALDNTIIATAIPQITNDFNSLADVGWYGSGYLLTTCAFQLSYGKLYNLFPLKWVFLVALALFEVGSLVCGAAPTSVGLIMGRVIAGIGSGGVFAGAILIVAEFKPLQERSIYNGILGSMYAIASVAGPLLGGAFTEFVTWRLCFYINLPLGLITAIVAVLLVPNNYDPERHARRNLPLREKARQMDLWGLCVLVPAIICILLAVQWGGAVYPWADGRIIALFIIGGLLFIGFSVIETRQGDRAIVPTSVVRKRAVWASASFGLLIFGSFFVICYYLPIWFQAIKGDNATQSGLHNLPSILGTTVFSIVSGGLVFAVGYYTWACMLAGMMAAVGAGLLSTLQVDTSAPKWIGYQILYGAGVGFGLNQPLIAVQAVLPQRQIAEGTAIIGFCQTFGGTIFIAVAQNVFNNQLASNVVADGIPIDTGSLLSVGATRLQTLVPPEFFDALQVAYNRSITQTFYVAVASAALSVIGATLIPWDSIKQPKTPTTVATDSDGLDTSKPDDIEKNDGNRSQSP